MSSPATPPPFYLGSLIEILYSLSKIEISGHFESVNISHQEVSFLCQFFSSRWFGRHNTTQFQSGASHVSHAELWAGVLDDPLAIIRGFIFFSQRFQTPLLEDVITKITLRFNNWTSLLVLSLPPFLVEVCSLQDMS